MGGNPRACRPHVQRPSPLAQVSHTRPLSQAEPTNGLVRDPLFWKRFSVAVHAAETTPDEESGSGSAKGSLKSSSTIELKPGNDWLIQQHKEKRRCRILCASITMVVIMVITAGAVCGWYFTNHR